MTTAQAMHSPIGSDWNESIVNLLIALGPGHSVRASGASSLMVYRGKKLAAEVQLGEPLYVSVWITVRVGSEADNLRDRKLRKAGQAALEAVLPIWKAKGFTRADDEYVDWLNPDDPTTVYVARLDATAKEFDQSVELIQWALDQERTFDAMEGDDDC